MELTRLQIVIDADPTAARQALLALGRDLKAAGDAATEAGNRIDEAAKTKWEAAAARMRTFGATATQAGRQLSIGLTTPLLAVGGFAIKTSADFEQTLNVFRATAGATAAQMAAVGREAKRLGADQSLANTSAKDAAEAMLELSRAGLKVKDVLGAASGTLRLSAAAQISNAKAAEVVGQALNAFKLRGTEATRVVDAFANATTKGVKIGDLAQGLAQAGTAFATSRQSVEDFTTSMALMAQAGIKGSDAGTSLKTMLARLNPDTKEAAIVMQALGVNAYDTHGRMLPMSNIVGQFEKSLKGMTDQQRQATLQLLFGADGVRAARVVLEGGKKAYDAMADSQKRQGTATEQANAQTKGFNGALQGLRSSLETLALAATPYLNSLAAGIRTFTAWVNKLNEAPPIVRNIVVGLGLFAAAIGPVLVFVGQVATGLAALMRGLVIARAGFTLAVTVVRVFLGALTPVGIAITAITAVVALFSAAWRGNWFHIRDVTRNVINQIGLGWSILRLGFSTLGSWVKSWFTDMGARFMAFGRSVIDGLINGIRSRITGVIGTVRSIGTTLANTFNAALGISSPSRVMHKAGQETVGGLVLALQQGRAKIEHGAIVMADGVHEGVKKSLRKGKASVDKEFLAYKNLLSEAKAKLAEALRGGDDEDQRLAARLRGLSGAHREEVAAIVAKTAAINTEREARRAAIESNQRGIERVQEMIRDARVEGMRITNTTPGDQIALEVFNVRYQQLTASTKAWVDQLIRARSELEATKILATSPVDIDAMARGAGGLDNVGIVGDMRIGGTRPGPRGTGALAGAMGEDAIGGAASRQARQLENVFRRIARGFENDLSRSFELLATRGIKPFFSSLLDSIKQTLIRTFAEMAAQRILQQILGTGNTAGGAAGGAMGGLLGGLGKFLPQIGIGLAVNSLLGNPLKKVGKLLGFAGGGRPPVGVPSVVGEEGPEIFVPDRPGRIVPNRASRGGGGNVQVTNQFFGPINHEADEVRLTGKIVGDVERVARFAFF